MLKELSKQQFEEKEVAKKALELFKGKALKEIRQVLRLAVELAEEKSILN